VVLDEIFFQANLVERRLYLVKSKFRDIEKKVMWTEKNMHTLTRVLLPRYLDKRP